MTNENPNEPNWKNKLEDVKGLSAEILQDKEAAWNRLQTRLDQKPRHITGLWYWIAAATVLMAISTPFFFLYKKQPVAEKDYFTLPSSRKTVTIPATIPGLNSGMETITKSPGKQPAAGQLSKRYDKIPSSNGSTTKADRFKDSTLQNTVEPLTNNIIQPVPEAPSIAILLAKPSKQQLKVVHINELGDAEPIAPSLVRTTDYHFFGNRLINQEVNSNTLLSINNTGFTIFKTGTGPTN